jgi:hypothetical protein
MQFPRKAKKNSEAPPIGFYETMGGWMSTQTRIKNCIIMPDKRHKLDHHEIISNLMEEEAKTVEYRRRAKLRRLKKSTVKKSKQASAPLQLAPEVIEEIAGKTITQKLTSHFNHHRDKEGFVVKYKELKDKLVILKGNIKLDEDDNSKKMHKG